MAEQDYANGIFTELHLNWRLILQYTFQNSKDSFEKKTDKLCNGN